MLRSFGLDRRSVTNARCNRSKDQLQQERKQRQQQKQKRLDDVDYQAASSILRIIFREGDNNRPRESGTRQRYPADAVNEGKQSRKVPFTPAASTLAGTNENSYERTPTTVSTTAASLFSSGRRGTASASTAASLSSPPPRDRRTDSILDTTPLPEAFGIRLVSNDAETSAMIELGDDDVYDDNDDFVRNVKAVFAEAESAIRDFELTATPGTSIKKKKTKKRTTTSPPHLISADSYDEDYDDENDGLYREMRSMELSAPLFREELEKQDAESAAAAILASDEDDDGNAAAFVDDNDVEAAVSRDDSPAVIANDTATAIDTRPRETVAKHGERTKKTATGSSSLEVDDDKRDGY